MSAAAGVTPAALRKAIAEKRVTPLADGSFDREAALAELARKTDPTQNRGLRPSKVAEAKAQAGASADLSSEVAAASTGDCSGIGYAEMRRRLDAGEPMDFMEARTANEILKAKQAAVKLDEAIGLLVPAAEVQTVREAENQALRDRIRSVPYAVAERLLDLAAKGAKAPELAELVLRELDTALSDMAEAVVDIAA